MLMGSKVVDGRRVVHERAEYELVIATDDEDGAYLIVLQPVDGGLSPLSRGLLAAKLLPGVGRDTAEMLLDNMAAMIDCWDIKWRPGAPDGPGRGVVVSLREAA